MISVNGKPHPTLPADLLALLAEEGVAANARGIAVAVNDTVVPRGAWPGTVLAPGDRVEIVKVLQGG